MIINLKANGLLLVASCLAASAHAVDINWSGFGTFGAGITLDSKTFYRTNGIAGENFDDNGDLDDQVNYEILSLIALQANASLGSGLSATVQIKAAGADNWDASIAWAYLSYDLTPKSKVQAGRKLIPVYSYTDSIDIGYTYHWIRPPAEVYFLAASKYDGINLLYQDFYGDWEISTNGLVGRLNDDEDIYGEAFHTSYRIWGGSVEATFDEWAGFRLARFIYEEVELENFGINNFPAEYSGAAVTLRPGNWSFIAEYAWYEIDHPNLDFGAGPIPNGKPINDLDSAWYVSAAYSMGRWTPHLTYSAREFVDQGSALGLSAIDSNTIIIGARYDFHPGASMKMEYHVFSDDTVTGGISTPQYGNIDDGTDAVQVAVDFIF